MILKYVHYIRVPAFCFHKPIVENRDIKICNITKSKNFKYTDLIWLYLHLIYAFHHSKSFGGVKPSTNRGCTSKYCKAVLKLSYYCIIMLELHMKIISYVTSSLIIQSKLIHNSRITENKKEKKIVFSFVYNNLCIDRI